MNDFAERTADANDVNTCFLVAPPTFLTGFGGLLGLWGGNHRYNVAQNGVEADARAIYSDWRIAGQDLRDALLSYVRASK